MNHQGHITESPLKTHKFRKHQAKQRLTHIVHITHVLFSIFSLTHLLPQVVHNPHDARQLSVLLFGGTLPLALLLGA